MYATNASKPLNECRLIGSPGPSGPGLSCFGRLQDLENPPYRHRIFQAHSGRASEGRVVPRGRGLASSVAVPRGGPLIPRWTL